MSWKQCGGGGDPNTDSVLSQGSAGTNTLHHALKLRGTFNEPLQRSQVQAPHPHPPPHPPLPEADPVQVGKTTSSQTAVVKKYFLAFATNDSRSDGGFLLRYLELRDADSGVGVFVEHP